MDRKKISIALIAIVMALPALKLLKYPGTGLLISLSMTSIAMFFMILATMPIRKFKWQPGKSEEDGMLEESNSLIIFEKILFISLAPLCIGSLFICQHWPGAGMMRWIGFIGAISAALGVIVFTNKGNCTYSSQLKSVALVSLLFAAVVETNYYWDFLFKTQHSDYHHLVAVYSNHSSDDPAKVKERQVELQKYYYITDSETYNHLDSLMIKANAMAQNEKNARVIYLLMNYRDEYNIIVNNIIFDNETLNGSDEIDHFAQDHRSLFHSNVKFYVVSNNPELATEKLKQLSSENKEIIIVE